MNFIERWVRKIAKDEINRYYQAIPEPSIQLYNEETGAEIIMPNPVREAFTDGRITSFKDITHG